MWREEGYEETRGWSKGRLEEEMMMVMVRPCRRRWCVKSSKGIIWPDALKGYISKCGLSFESYMFKVMIDGIGVRKWEV